MNLVLKRPIAFFDLETTGTNVAKDRIVEISILKLHPNGEEEIKTRRINPEMPIPKESSEIHGIYDKDVEGEKPFRAIAKSLAQFIGNSDLAGYNSNKFDVPLLAEEFLRVGVDFDLNNRNLVDVQNIFHKIEPRTLVASYQFYCGKSLENAHSAEDDTKATFEVLKAIINRAETLQKDIDLLKSLLDTLSNEDEKERLNKMILEKALNAKAYKGISRDVDFLAEFSERNKTVDLMGRIVYDENGVEVFNFGKYKGESVKSVLESNPGYYSWMMNGDFPNYTKKVLTAIKLKGAFSR